MLCISWGAEDRPLRLSGCLHVNFWRHRRRGTRDGSTVGRAWRPADAPPKPAFYDRVSRRLFDDLFLFNRSAMLAGMVLSRFTGVVGRMEPMPVSDMGVVRRLLVIAGFMVQGSFAMMSCRLFVVFCRLVVVLCACVHTHTSHVSCDDGISQPGESPCRPILALKVTPDSLTA